jgi:hypothetical protein
VSEAGGAGKPGSLACPAEALGYTHNVTEEWRPELPLYEMAKEGIELTKSEWRAQ